MIRRINEIDEEKEYMDEAGSILMHIPVYGVMHSTESDWIRNCNISRSDYRKDDAESLGRTYGLLELTGILNQESNKDKYESMYENKIADVVLCISGFPVKE